ncbi:MAG: winged helix-turn-helix domain-containing protein [Blastocatellia bacterium]
MAKQTARSISQQGSQHGAQQGKTHEAKSRSSARVEQAMRAAEKAPELDGLIHERIRLGIVSALAANESLTFSELKGLLKTTDGNISVHARKLEDADYISCSKSFVGRMPKTEYRLTEKGRRALENYLNHMEALIRAARER